MDTQSTLSQPSSETSELPGGSSSASSEVRALEDVAIVGMSCRTSGGVKTPEELWQFLLDKKNGSGTVPLFRWEPWLRRDSRNAKEIDKTIRKGYFIHDLENFDAAFFGISPKEAEQMDPHQRLGLELAWEALERAGINPKDLCKSDTAVYMGIDSDDYSRLLMEDIPNIEPWMAIGTAAHGVANRISYHLDLMGPSAAVDAACASSLAAVHNGSQAIQLGESEVALVGGVNVLLAPALTRMLDKAGALSPEGVCRSFDDAANGYARGEGGAVLVLKRLSSAIRDGDHIWSILKGSAVAQDGKTNGIMAPNAAAQELVGRQALSRADLHPSSIGYVEAHATSTPLGDPTEITAISQLYGRGAGRAASQPCKIGSIKPNIGHLEAASGAIGMLKAVLAVDKGELAPQTLFEKPNSRIDWESSGLEVVRHASKWEEANDLIPRRAAVCSYGYGGTVSHAIIEQYQPPTVGGSLGPDEGKAEGQVMITITAPTEKRVIAQTKALADWLATPQGRESNLGLVASTLAQRRVLHVYRVAFLVKDHDDAVDQLHKIISQNITRTDPIATGRVLPALPSHATSAVWIFSGHGAQWLKMGCELIHNSIFLTAMRELETTISREAGFSVTKSFETGDFEDTERAQIMTFAIQYGLSCLLRSHGLVPGAIIGHSIGEICAAVVAGCMTPSAGALIVARRSKLLSAVRGQGAMALVHLPFESVNEELSPRTDVVAAIDVSPTSCVISGEAEAVAAYVQRLQDRDIETFNVKSDVAFHSPMLNQLQAPFRDQLSGRLKPKPATIPLYSTSLDVSRDGRLRDADYWINNMMKPVWLRKAIQEACEDGYRSFLEVSSHPIVIHSVRETIKGCGLEDKDTVKACTMRRDSSAKQSIKLSIAQMFVRGVRIDFSAMFGDKRLWCRNVPRTQWLQQPYYKQVETGAIGASQQHDPDSHSLLGSQTLVAGTDVVIFTTTLSIDSKPFPGNHPLDGTEIIPAGVYINTFHQATGTRELHDLQLRVPVSMTSDLQSLQVTVQGDRVSMASAMHRTEVSLNRKESWVQHANCRLSRIGSRSDLPVLHDIQATQRRIGTRLADTFAVDFLSSIGVSGIAFPWKVLAHYGNEEEMIVKVDMMPDHDEVPWDKFSWAPLIDAATSVGSSIFFTKPTLRIISAIERIQLISADSLPKIIFLFVQRAPTKQTDVLAAHVQMLTESGQVLGELRSMTLSEVEGGASRTDGGIDQLVHQIDWVPLRFTETPRSLGHVVLVSPDTERLKQLCASLEPGASSLVSLSDALELTTRPEILRSLLKDVGSVVYAPGRLQDPNNIADSAYNYVWDTASILRTMIESSLAEGCKLFVMTNGIHKGASSVGLAQGALVGLGRIIAAEHPEIWGGLIDNDDDGIDPVLALRYADGHDVLRNLDGLPRRAVMRPLSRKLLHASTTDRTLIPNSHGTYIVTGGLGFLGLETADFLIQKGARRILLISRRCLPPRSTWSEVITRSEDIAETLLRIQEMEKLGVTVNTLALDIALPSAAQTLHKALDAMQLPEVKGVVHCAGVLEDSLVLATSQDSFHRVMDPKVRGSLTLHEAFPPGRLDFLVLYSSIGQLVGTAGQASYGAGNAFLDALAVYRRSQGDNTVALQMTALRGDAGMGASTDFLKVELESKGITDISSQEAFWAWEHLGKFDLASAVVTRCLAIEEGEEAAVPILEDIVRRRPQAQVAGSQNSIKTAKPKKSTDSRPSEPEKLKVWVMDNVRQCIATVLMMPDPSEIEGETTVNELGVDSVLTVTLRKHLQDTLGIKVPPTLTWKHPTVISMVSWFMKRLSEE